MAGIPSLSFGGDKSASANYGDISSNNKLGASFPFGAPSANNTLIYIGLGALLAVLVFKRKR